MSSEEEELVNRSEIESTSHQSSLPALNSQKLSSSASLPLLGVSFEDNIQVSGPYWCSWCLRLAPQKQTKWHSLSRNQYQCGLCHNRTLRCVRCSNGMSKYFETYTDKLCIVCDRTLKDWPLDAELSTFDNLKKRNVWCSWCFENGSHSLQQKNFLTRDVYRCDTCGKRTLICRKCSEGMTKGSISYDNQYCAKCDNIIHDWRDTENNVMSTRKMGWCSWCIESTEHIQQTKPLVGRSVYQCSLCNGRTLPCTICSTGFTKGGLGWDDTLCAECQGQTKGGWIALRSKKEHVFNTPRSIHTIIESLKKESEYRKRAENQGMIRPFLLLVGMSPLLRVQLANHLEISLVIKEFFGDVHQEADFILFESKNGIIPRMLKSFEKLLIIPNWYNSYNWYYVMTGVIQSIWKTCETIQNLSISKKKSFEMCANCSDETISGLEEEFFLKFIATMKSTMTEEQLLYFNSVSQNMEKEVCEEIIQQIQINSGIERDEILNYALNIVLQASEVKEFVTNVSSSKNPTWKNFITPLSLNLLLIPAHFLAVAGILGTTLYLALSSSEGRLLIPISIILNQRLIFAVEGINLCDYYSISPLTTTSSSSPPSPTTSSSSLSSLSSPS